MSQWILNIWRDYVNLLLKEFTLTLAYSWTDLFVCEVPRILAPVGSCNNHYNRDTKQSSHPPKPPLKSHVPSKHYYISHLYRALGFPKCDKTQLESYSMWPFKTNFSLPVMYQGCICVVVCTNISLSLIAEWYSTVWKYHSVFIYSPTRR